VSGAMINFFQSKINRMISYLLWFLVSMTISYILMNMVKKYYRKKSIFNSYRAISRKCFWCSL